MYRPDWTKQAKRDYEDIKRARLEPKFKEILKVLCRDPYEPTVGHRFEKLVGYPKETYSRRLNSQHRFIYEVLPNTENDKDRYGNPYQGIVKVISMWGHKYR
jgi:toxin YoeB